MTTPTDNRYIRREDALKAIDPGYGDFHAGDYNAIAALPCCDLTEMLEGAQRKAFKKAARVCERRVEEIINRHGRFPSENAVILPIWADKMCEELKRIARRIRKLANNQPAPNPVDGKIGSETVGKGGS